MGCDIHIYTERRLPDGTWESLDSAEEIIEDNGDTYYDIAHKISVSRNYTLFGLIAKGVRCEFDVSLEQKGGFPHDSSQLSIDEMHRWDSDGHSASWLTLEEIKDHLIKILLLPDEPNLQYALEDYRTIKDKMEKCKLEGMSDSDIRILFFFDN